MPKPSLFISYSSRDRAFAESLHAALEADGFTVWRDQTRLEQDWSKEIAQALAESTVILLLWSGDSALSKWVAHEWLTARALEKYILPCFLPNAPDLPAPLSNIHGIPASDPADCAAAVAARLAAVNSSRVAYDYTVVPTRTYIPFNPNPDFTGRSADMLALYLAVVGNLNKSGLTHVGVVGMAGIGKTQLVVEFAHRFAFGFPEGIFWIQAADADQWQSQLVELARDRLHLPLPDSQEALQSRRYLLALQDWCRAHPGALLVMDNVRDPELLNNDTRLFGLTPLTLGCNVLFTTRKRVALPGVRMQSVDALEPAAAYSLLTAHSPPASDHERDCAIAIANAVAYLPLALTLAAGYLAKYLEVSFADYLAELNLNKLGVIDIGALTADELATRHEASVSVTLTGQWNMLKDETARHVFRLLGQFPEAAIVPEARIVLLTGIVGKSKLDRPVSRALNLLADLHLAERLKADRSSIRLHPLVREFSASLTATGKVGVLRQSAAEHVQSAYDQAERLASEVDARGPSEVIADISLALSWSEPASDVAAALEPLQRLLDRERHNLLADRGVSVLQQLHYRAFYMRLKGLAGRFLQASQRPLFVPLAVSRYEDFACVRTFAGHSAAVTCLSIDAAGKRLVSGSDDKSVIVWDIEFGKALHRFQQEDEVRHVALSADGRSALSAGNARRVTLWDLRSGEASLVFEGLKDGNLTDDIGARSIRFHEAGPYTASAWLGITFIAWNRVTRTTSCKHQDLDGIVSHVSLNGDGTQALIYLSAHWFNLDDRGHTVPAPRNDRLIIVDTRTGEVLHRFPQPLEPIGAIHLTPDGNVAVAGFRRNLLSWRVTTGEIIRFEDVHDDWVSALDMTPDQQLILSGGQDHTLTLWNARTGRAIRRYRGHSDTVTAAAFQPDGRHAISASADRTLMLWDVHSSLPAHEAVGHTGSTYAIDFNGDGTRALTGSFDRTLILWDAARAAPLRTYAGHQDAIQAVSLSPDEKSALSACANQEVLLWDLEAGIVRHTLRGHRNIVSAVAFSPDGRRAVSSCREAVIVWDLETGKPLSAAIEDGYWYLRVGFTSDGQQVVTCAMADIVVWDIVGPELKQHRRMKGIWYQSVYFEPDAGLAIASAVGSLYLWDLTTGELKKKFVAHSHDVQAVCLSRDGRYAVSACKDERALVLWDMDSATALARLLVNSPVVKMTIAGTRLAFTDESRLVHFVELDL